MRIARVAATTLAASAAVLATSTTAHAGSETVKDSTGDVWEVVYDQSTGNEEFIPAGEVTNVDLKKTKVQHTQRRVGMTATYADLAKGGIEPIYYAFVKVPGDTVWLMGVGRYEGAATPILFEYASTRGSDLARSRHAAVDARGSATCDGAKASLSHRKDTMEVSFPRACFDNPAWVKAHVISIGEEQVSESETHQYVDNGHNDSHDFKGWTGRIRRG